MRDSWINRKSIYSHFASFIRKNNINQTSSDKPKEEFGKKHSPTILNIWMPNGTIVFLSLFLVIVKVWKKKIFLPARDGWWPTLLHSQDLRCRLFTSFVRKSSMSLFTTIYKGPKRLRLELTVSKHLIMWFPSLKLTESVTGEIC